jgi:putative transcription factor
MRCEICGKKIIGKPLRVKIESSVMQTCDVCAKFGIKQREPPKITGSKIKRKPLKIREPTNEVLEDYNKFVREARENKGWSREDLAHRIYEKVSVINRIESGKMIPDLKLARKLEKTLEIKLLEKTELPDSNEFGSSLARGATIGDIAKIKKN